MTPSRIEKGAALLRRLSFDESGGAEVQPASPVPG